MANSGRLLAARTRSSFSIVRPRRGRQDNGYRVKDECRKVVELEEADRTAMSCLAGMRNLDVWYASADIDWLLDERGSQITPARAKRTGRALAKARTRDSMSAFSKL